MTLHRVGLALIAVISIALMPASGQSASSGSVSSSASSTQAVPYGPDEFPDWQKDLRRAEIISFGALPFVTFMASIYYDVYRYYDHAQDEAYLPWPLKKQDIAEPLSESEQKNVLFASIGISVGVAVFDFAWHTIGRLRERGIRDRELRSSSKPITITPMPRESANE